MPQQYGQLQSVADAATRQLLQQIIDQLSTLHADLANLPAVAARLQAEMGQRPTAAQVRAYVLQQVDALRTAPTDATYPVEPGVPGVPNVVPADALPLFDGTAIVQGVFAANPGLIPTSCQTASGGNWDLMDAIVDALRAADTRFAYNGKRGNASDPSLDAVSYDYAATPGGEGSPTVYIVDVIAGHCGPSPGPAFQDVTVFAPGVWISRGRF